MKSLSGSARADLAAPVEVAYAVLSDVERYRDWYPDVIRAVTVLERDGDGAVSLADVTLSAPGVPIGDLHARLRVDRQPPRRVALIREPDEPGDEEELTVAWTIDPAGPRSRLALALDARLPVPRLVPLGGIGDRMAAGFVRAAVRAISPG